MLLKTLILSATIFPFPLGLKGDRVRGRSVREGLSPSPFPTPFNAEPVRPTMTDPHGLSVASEPVVGPVQDASQDRVIPLADKKKNASRNVTDLDTYWDRMDGLKVASTRAFARWMREQNLYGDLSLRDLMSVYTEFCWTYDLKPLSERSLLNRLKKAGFETRRPPATVVDKKLHRPTIYRLKRQTRRLAA